MDLHYHPGLQCFAGPNIYVYMYIYIYLYLYLYLYSYLYIRYVHRGDWKRGLCPFTVPSFGHMIYSVKTGAHLLYTHTYTLTSTYMSYLFQNVHVIPWFFRGNRWTKNGPFFYHHLATVALSLVASQELYTDSDNLGPNSSINGSYPAQEKGSDLPIFWVG